MVIVEFLDIFLGFHLNGKTPQSRVVIMVLPHVCETRGGRLHTTYRFVCFTNPYQNVILWLKRVGLAEGELLGFKGTEGTELGKQGSAFQLQHLNNRQGKDTCKDQLLQVEKGHFLLWA